MGGFSDNYECGYWDEVSPIKPKISKKIRSLKTLYTPISQSDYLTLYVALTPSSSLTSQQQDNRDNLIQLCSTLTPLELSYNEENRYISLYYEEELIGQIARSFNHQNQHPIINTFCFKENQLEEIEAFWDGENFLLKKRV